MLKMWKNLGGFTFHWRQNKLIQTKPAMQVTMGLQCDKLGHDRFMGWVQEPPEFLIAWSALHIQLLQRRISAY